MPKPCSGDFNNCTRFCCGPKFKTDFLVLSLSALHDCLLCFYKEDYSYLNYSKTIQNYSHNYVIVFYRCNFLIRIAFYFLGLFKYNVYTCKPFIVPFESRKLVSLVKHKEIQEIKRVRYHFLQSN